MKIDWLKGTTQGGLEVRFNINHIVCVNREPRGNLAITTVDGSNYVLQEPYSPEFWDGIPCWITFEVSK